MKTKIKTILLTLTLLSSSSLLAENKALKQIIEKVPMLKNLNAKILEVKTHQSLHQFKVQVSQPRPGVFEGFITKDFKNIVIGQGFDANNGQPLLMPLPINTKELKEISAYTLGNGKKEFFLFTDPECPYCHKLEKNLTSIKKDVKLYVILYPLSFHKNAKSMSMYILSQNNNTTKAKAMKEIANGSKAYTEAKYSASDLEKYNKQIDASIALVDKIGVRGTPTIVDSKGYRVSDLAVRD